MSYLSEIEISTLRNSLITEEADLIKEYRTRKLSFYTYSESYNHLDARIEEGWEIEKRLKNKVKIKKEKPFNVYFEDKVWCFFYEMGFRILNKDEHLKLKYGVKEFNKQQIDVIAINDEVAFIVECKASQSSHNVTYKKDLESLRLKKDGYKKCIKDLFGDRRIKLVLATENQSLNKVDKERLEDEKAFHLDDEVFRYMNDLLRIYKNAATYQIMATFFKGEIINDEKIRIPAIKGKMGDQRYFMFSIKPFHLLKIGFVSHRTRANKLDMPTYQRLIVPSRLKNLNQFIEEDNGYFPNSVIINFDTKEHSLGWEEGKKGDYDSDNITHGTLLIPNTYGFAYIIDGQHRIYGYADTSKLNDHTIPVVAFEKLSSTDQLEMFLNINQNQKAISKSLKITLQQDVYWNSSDLKSRMQALNSGIINYLGKAKEPLKSLLTIGEDKAVFSMDNISNAIRRAGLIPGVSRNEYVLNSACLYDGFIIDKDRAMNEAVERIGDLISELYAFINEQYSDLYNPEHKLLYSNRANFALVYVLSEINRFLTNKKLVYLDSDLEDRWSLIKPYFESFLEGYRGLDSNELQRTLSVKGQGAEKAFAMLILSIINNKHKDFTTDELESWKETQDKALQDLAADKINSIEKLLKQMVFTHLEYLFDDNYEYKVKENIVSSARERAESENRKRFEELNEINEKLTWEDMLYIKDYKEIIRDSWGRRKADEEKGLRFQDLFSFDTDNIKQENDSSFFEIGKVTSKDKGTKWLDDLQSLRNKIAHRATRAEGLDRNQVSFVELIHRTIHRSCAKNVYD